MQADKGLFLELYATGVLTLEQAAIDGPGVDQATIWRWRQADPTFDAQVRDLQRQVDEIRGAMVEDSFFASIMTGNASTGGVLAWLERRNHRRWARPGPGGPPTDDDRPLVPVEVLRRIMARREARKERER